MQYIFVVLFLFIGVVESIRRRKLTTSGAIAGGLIGFFIFSGAGFTGLAMLSIFFGAGTAATAWRREQKSRHGMAQEEGGQRRLGQVLANGGAGGLLGLLAVIWPEFRDAAALMMAGAFSAAMADTLSSELGTVYGKKFYNIISFKKDQKGRDGVVSLEGTLVGVAGSCLMAVVYCTGFGWSSRFFWIVLAGTVGNLVDSLLGATLERKGRINNNLVNLLNTVVAALVLLAFVYTGG